MLWEAGCNKVMNSKLYPTNFNVFAISFVSKKFLAGKNAVAN
jgi:hypothetical protein